MAKNSNGSNGKASASSDRNLTSLDGDTGSDERKHRDDEFDLTEWQQIQEDWERYQPDIAKIKKRIAWVTWRMVAVLVIDVLVVLTYIPFLLYWVLPTDDSLMIKVWHYFMFPALIYGVYLDFKLRLPLFNFDDSSTRGILESYLKLVNAGAKLGRWGFRFCVGLMFAFIAWFSTAYFLELGNEKFQKLSTLFIGLAWFVGFAAIMLWYERKKNREASRLAELWKEYI